MTLSQRRQRAIPANLKTPLLFVPGTRYSYSNRAFNVLAVVLERATVGAHSASAVAAGFGSAFWWALGMTALAVIPCYLLMQAERRARATPEGAEAEREAIETGEVAEAIA